MPPASVRARVPQAFDILQNTPLQLVLDLHAVQVGVQVQDLLLRELAHLHVVVQVEARHDLLGDERADAEEGLQGAGHEAPVGEVAGEEEDLCVAFVSRVCG